MMALTERDQAIQTFLTIAKLVRVGFRANPSHDSPHTGAAPRRDAEAVRRQNSGLSDAPESPRIDRSLGDG